MASEEIIALLIQEREKLNRAIAALQGGTETGNPKVVVTAEVTAKKRFISAAARRKMALGQKKRWAALKAAKT